MFSKANCVIHKVSANDKEALESDIIVVFEIKRCRKCFSYVEDFVKNY
jgi:hypothetical protein